MKSNECPQCRNVGRMLLFHLTWVDYYHCDGCHSSWSVDWRDPSAQNIIIATPVTKTPAGAIPTAKSPITLCFSSRGTVY